MAGERVAGTSDDDEELRKRKRIGELFSAPRRQPEGDKTSRALDLGRVASEVGGETRKPKKAQDHEAKQGEASEDAELRPDEQAAAERRLIAARKEAVNDERTDADPADVAEIDADIAYLDDVDRRVQAGASPLDAAEEAYAAKAGLTDEDPIEGEFGGAQGTEGEVPLHSTESNTPDNDTVDAGSPDQPTTAAGATLGSTISRTVHAGASATAEAFVPAAARVGAEVVVAGGILALLVGNFVTNRLKEKPLPGRQAKAMKRSFERQVQQLHDQLTVHEEQIRRLARERNNLLQVARKVEVPHAASAAERKPTQPETVHANAPVPDVERMVMSDVLDLAQNIRVGGESLRQIYEDDRISQRGLRRAVETYLHGGNVRQVLKQELLIKAIAMELDPVLRDRAPEAADAAAAAISSANEDRRDNTPHAPDATPVTEEQSAPPSPLTEHRRISTPTLVIMNIVALAILGVLILILLTLLKLRQSN